MSARLQAKTYVERLPEPLGRLLARVPFSARFGTDYVSAKRLLLHVRNLDAHERAQWALARLQAIIERAYAENRFYRRFYDRRGYHPGRLTSLEHFRDVPIVSKRDLSEFALDDRSVPARGRLRLNTGGTSGEPLEFYVDAKAFAREWAHMHWIWERKGYSYRDLKITLRGRNLGETLLRYNPVHNEYLINTYADQNRVADAIAACDRTAECRWVHGYPSVVSEFCLWTSAHRPDVLARLKNELKGVLLGSEFPAAHYRRATEDNLGVPITVWYGHSEMSALAYECAENEYEPLLSYGFAEGVEMPDGVQHLVATSYWNGVSPFIRYDTGDCILADVQEGLVRRFQIVDGRIGDFVVDRRGGRIGLTALIFGRHHPGFERARHVQVRQNHPGTMELLVVPREPGRLNIDDLEAGFDFTHVDLDITLRVIDEPVRSRSGKIPLMV